MLLRTHWQDSKSFSVNSLRLKCSSYNSGCNRSAARREQGEAMEQIMESMGSPEEIAEAFSQNLSDADRKAYKRRRIGMTIGQIVAVLVFLSVLAWWMIPKPASLGDDLSQEAVTASVENVVVMLNQNDFDGVQELAVDELKSKLTQETMDEVRKGISEDWGEMQSIGKVYMQGLKQKGKVMVVTQVDAVYENVSVVYTISFDEDLRLGGLYMR